MRPLVIVGDTLLDIDVEGDAERLCPEAPVPIIDVAAQRCRPGGAGLAATLAATSGHRVILVTALGDDEAGRRLAQLLRRDIEVVPLRLNGTTVVKQRVRSGGQTLLRLDTGDGRADPEAPEPAARRALAEAGAVLVADYGRGAAEHPRLRRLLTEAATRIPVVWDPHPNGPDPVEGTTLVTPNEPEALGFTARLPEADTADPAARLRKHWRSHAVAVTRGSRGAVLAEPASRNGNGSRRNGDRFAASTVRQLPVPAAARGRYGPTDTCGAGDRFAATATAALLDGATVARAVASAVAEASAFVADGGAAAVHARRFRSDTVAQTGPDSWAPAPTAETADLSDTAALTASPATVAELVGDPPRDPDPREVAERIHRDGATLVATGGCFDLLHPGHLRLLRQARAHGDALIVCLNSDESVSRLKGPGRPILPAADRKRMLLAYDFVDAVAVFTETTPRPLLDRLRPHVWVKGGDYTENQLPEADVVRRHGGRIVLIPMADGYSTTKLVAAGRS